MMQQKQTAVLRMAACLGIGAMGLLTGCGADFFSAVNNNPLGSGSTYAYVTNSTGTSGTLSAYSLTSGVLAQLTGSPYTLDEVPTAVAVAPDNKFLLVGTSLGIFLYTINSDGTLTAGNSGTVIYIGENGSTTVQSMVIDSTSSWVIVANTGSSELDALSLDPTTGVPSSSATAGITLNAATPLQVAISPGNTHVFVALGANGAEELTFNSGSGATWSTTVANLPVSNSGGSDTSVAVDSTSTYVFIGESTTNLVRSLPVGNFTAANETDVATGENPSAVLADLSGSYVYVATQSDNSISAYSEAAGKLTQLSDSPFSTAKAPIAMAEDSSKTYLYTLGSKGNPNVWVYNFDTTTGGDLDVKTTTSTESATTYTATAIAVTH